MLQNGFELLFLSAAKEPIHTALHHWQIDNYLQMKKLFLGILLSISFFGNAQKNANDVLFTINKTPYYTDEFVRVYNKNLDLVKDESQKDLDQYLDLYIGYKVKIQKANKLGLQDGEAYKNELSSYRSQLAKNYITDSKVTESLVEEGYQRSLKEIRASHILINLDENAAPVDTLKAYKKINDIRNRAVAGEDFGTLAEQFSQDPSAKDNKGDLGYFSAFRMVYPFENAAYKTQVGQVSKPFRTRFGYHIMKVNDIRDNRGEVTVEHIMLLFPENGDAAEMEKVKTKVMEIYKKIQQGENFEELAKQFSEDKSSASKGGLLNKFGSGQLTSDEFENAAFSLKNKNEISAPFESRFGWHIIKLIEKHASKTLDEVRPELEAKVGKDDRSRLIAESINEKLRKKYIIKRDEKLYNRIVAAVTAKDGSYSFPSSLDTYSAALFKIQDTPISGADFLSALRVTQKTAAPMVKPMSKWVAKNYEIFVDQKLNGYYNDHLEDEFPEFGAIMDEYRDGLLLFDLMEKEIWDRSKADTLGLESFYQSRKANYMWKPRADVLIISSTKMNEMKDARKLLKKGTSADDIKKKFNTNDKVEVMSNAGVFEQGSETLPKSMKFEIGISDVFKEGDYYYVVKVNKVMPAGVKTLEECRGKCVNDYQQYLEQGWVDTLKEEFSVKVDRSVFDKVKKQLKG